MKIVTLFTAVLALPASSLMGKGLSEVEILKSRIDAQERRIDQLEKTIIRLGGHINQREVKVAPKKVAVKKSAPLVKNGENLDIYVVKKGDMLSRIAYRHHTTVEMIKKANGMTDDSIKVGQKLRVPKISKTAQNEVKKATSTKPSKEKSTASKSKEVSKSGIYVVQAGDTFYGIARRFGMTEAALKAANPKAKPTLLQIGQELVIQPGKKKAKVTKKNVVKAKEKKRTHRSSVAKTSHTPKPATPSKSKKVTSTAKKEVKKTPKKTVSTAKSERKPVDYQTVTVRRQMTYGEFAGEYGTNTEMLNSLNGLSLSKSTPLAKGSELYVPLYR